MAHLTLEQRCTISVMHARGESQRTIALTIEKSPSAVSRELRMNSDGRSGTYHHRTLRQSKIYNVLGQEVATLLNNEE